MDPTVVVSLLFFAGWAALSAYLGELLIPAGFHRPVAQPEPADESTWDEKVDVADAASPAGEGSYAAFEGVSDYQPGGADREFWLAAATAAVEDGLDPKGDLLWWGKTKPGQVPQRGRPNHYFAFDAHDDRAKVYEVRHNGRAGGGANVNARPNTFTIPKSNLGDAE